MDEALTPTGQLRAAARRLAHAVPLDTAAAERTVAALCDDVPGGQNRLRLRELEHAHRIVIALRNWQRDAELHGRHLRLHTRVGKILADVPANPHRWVRRTVAAGILQAYPERLMDGISIPHHSVPDTGATAIASARQAIHYALLFGHDPGDITRLLENPDRDVARYRYVAGDPLDDTGRYLAFTHRPKRTTCTLQQVTTYPRVHRWCSRTERIATAIDKALLAIPDDFEPGAHAGRVACARLWSECRRWQRSEIFGRLRTAGLEPVDDAATKRLSLLPEALLADTRSVQAFVRDHRAPRDV